MGKMFFKIFLFQDSDLVSISSTFYQQLLCTQIPKVQKDTNNLIEVLHFWGSSHVKAARKHVGEIDPDKHRKNQIGLCVSFQNLSSDFEYKNLEPIFICSFC